MTVCCNKINMWYHGAQGIAQHVIAWGGVRFGIYHTPNDTITYTNSKQKLILRQAQKGLAHQNKQRQLAISQKIMMRLFNIIKAHWLLMFTS